MCLCDLSNEKPVASRSTQVKIIRRDSQSISMVFLFISLNEAAWIYSHDSELQRPLFTVSTKKMKKKNKKHQNQWLSEYFKALCYLILWNVARLQDIFFFLLYSKTTQIFVNFLKEIMNGFLFGTRKPFDKSMQCESDRFSNNKTVHLFPLQNYHFYCTISLKFNCLRCVINSIFFFLKIKTEFKKNVFANQNVELHTKNLETKWVLTTRTSEINENLQNICKKKHYIYIKF